MTTAYSESSTERLPGRSWTVRLTGHSDRSAAVTCSTAACKMPARSKDVAALRAFAARHAHAHARAATIRPDASCHCRAQQCAAHPRTETHCSGGVVLIMRHDAGVGRVWSVEEVCASCAPLILNATVVARAERSVPAQVPPAPKVAVRARPSVPGGFSSAGAPTDPTRQAAPNSRRSGPRPPRRRRPAQGR